MALEAADLDQIKTMIGEATKPEALKLHLGDVVKSVVAESIAPVAESVTKLSETVAKLPTAGAADPAAVQKLVTAQVQAGLAAHAKAASEAQAAAAEKQKLADARNKFLAERATKLPPQYHSLITETADPAQARKRPCRRHGKAPGRPQGDRR